MLGSWPPVAVLCRQQHTQEPVTVLWGEGCGTAKGTNSRVLELALESHELFEVLLLVDGAVDGVCALVHRLDALLDVLALRVLWVGVGQERLQKQLVPLLRQPGKCESCWTASMGKKNKQEHAALGG